MKKALLFLIVIGLCSCTDKVEKEVQRYLENNVPFLESLELLEASEIDSVYDPTISLMRASRLNSEALSKVYSAYEYEDYAESLNRFNFVLDSLGESFDAIDSVLMNTERLFRLLEFDIGATSPNAKGIKVKYRINGLLRTDLFYYGSTGITGSTLEVEKRYKELGEEILGRKKEIGDIRKFL